MPAILFFPWLKHSLKQCWLRWGLGVGVPGRDMLKSAFVFVLSFISEASFILLEAVPMASGIHFWVPILALCLHCLRHCFLRSLFKEGTGATPSCNRWMTRCHVTRSAKQVKTSASWLREGKGLFIFMQIHMEEAK